MVRALVVVGAGKSRVWPGAKAIALLPEASAARREKVYEGPTSVPVVVVLGPSASTSV